MANKLITTGNIQPLLTDVAEKISDINEQLHEPQTVNIEYPNNTAQVSVDATGTKYNMIESPESTIELNGRTLVNLWKSDNKDNFSLSDTSVLNEDGSITCEGTSQWNQASYKKIELFKPNTEYTLFTIVYENTLDSFFYPINTSNVGCIFNGNPHVMIGAGFTGTHISKVVSKTDFTDCNTSIRSFVDIKCTTGKITFKCVVLEGDYTNVPVKYFEGLKSAGETKGIEVKSIGKNLIDIVNDEHYSIGTNTFVIKDNKITFNATPNLYGIRYDIGDKFEIGKTYKMSFAYEGDELKSSCGFRLVAKDGTHVYPDGTTIVPKATFTINKEIEAVQIYVGMPYTGQKQITLSNIQIEKGVEATEYEPYKENIVTLPEVEPLRSLPNGVCDEAFIHDDKLVITRNLSEIVLNGTENITAYYDGTYCFNIYHSPNIPIYYDNAQILVINDKLNSFSADDMYLKRNDTGNNFITARKNGLIISVNDFTSIDEIKTWLVNNNVTVIYKLATPTYEWYELPSPYLYKDGNIFVETGAIPLTANSHEINVSMRSVIDTNVEEITQIKEELNTLDLEIATQEDVGDMWQGLLKGGTN